MRVGSSSYYVFKISSHMFVDFEVKIEFIWVSSKQEVQLKSGWFCAGNFFSVSTIFRFLDCDFLFTCTNFAC